MTLRPYKFVVKAIAQQLDENGVVVGEVETQPVTVFGCDALSSWAVAFPELLGESVTEGKPT